MRRNDAVPQSDRLSPRQAVNVSCYFLNVLTGRKPAAGAKQLATAHGWVAFARVRRRVPSRFRRVRVRRIACPGPDIAEIVAMVEDGRTHRAMTFTFRATVEGWRLDDCDLLDGSRR
ncbi:Rv3235 family protein [Glycomyces xiaoerkulensis]|uniref:Rv3235 family protein n=1 Tax=Glycomyces xiaoerkulensis TaxID=2038139 RepID=UPI000C25880A|nr:Rv3235 family protein [Glycomyces xiaoerkulensis]